MYIYIYIYITYIYIYIFLYKKCYHHQLLQYRRSIFTEQKIFKGCHQIYKATLKNKLAASRFLLNFSTWVHDHKIL